MDIETHSFCAISFSPIRLVVATSAKTCCAVCLLRVLTVSNVLAH